MKINKVYFNVGGEIMANFSTNTAKPNRDLLRDFAKGNLNLSKRAIDLIIVLTKYVDHDGRIHIDKESVRKEMFCNRRTLNSILFELTNSTYKEMKLLTYENGYYISHFHVSSKGESTYQKYLPVFSSAKIYNLTKNQSRLFYYIATLNVYNQDTKVAIENLYKNTLHDLKYGMSVYDDYKSVAEDLFHLIELDLVSVRFPGEKSAFNANKSLSEFKAVFHRTCGYVNEKKLRTSKYHKKKHVIGLRLNPDLYNEKAISNTASESEIRLLAERFHMFHEDMKEDTFNFFINKKNLLMEQFGPAGLEIYRSSLEKYFKEKNENILYYDILGKAENHFTDFYLLEEVKKVILGSIQYALGNMASLSDTGYSIANVHIPSLVSFFVNHSSKEAKVLIDQDIQLIQKANELMSGDSTEPHWAVLQESIEAVYQNYMAKLSKQYRAEFINLNVIPSYAMIYELEQNSRKIIVELAQQKLLSQQKDLEEETNKIKQVVSFISKKYRPIIIDDNEKPIELKKDEEPPYSWIYKD
jgi:hypothetical protein